MQIPQITLHFQQYWLPMLWKTKIDQMELKHKNTYCLTYPKWYLAMQSVSVYLLKFGVAHFEDTGILVDLLQLRSSWSFTEELSWKSSST